MLPRFGLTGASILCRYVEAVLAYVQAYRPFCSIASSESPPAFYAFFTLINCWHCAIVVATTEVLLDLNLGA
jgi:hypothetical protein